MIFFFLGHWGRKTHLFDYFVVTLYIILYFFACSLAKSDHVFCELLNANDVLLLSVVFSPSIHAGTYREKNRLEISDQRKNTLQTQFPWGQILYNPYINVQFGRGDM